MFIDFLSKLYARNDSTYGWFHLTPMQCYLFRFIINKEDAHTGPCKMSVVACIFAEIYAQNMQALYISYNNQLSDTIYRLNYVHSEFNDLSAQFF